MEVYYTKTKGRYNICSNEIQWCVHLVAGDIRVSETWDEDDEPYIDNEMPSEVAERMRERLESYWIATRREENLKKYDAIRENAEQIDSEWAKGKIESLQKEIARLQRYVMEGQ